MSGRHRFSHAENRSPQFPSALWSFPWHVSVHVPFEYESTPLYGLTTLMSKLTNRWPEIVPEPPAGTPCPEWQTEQENPVPICSLCPGKLALDMMLFKSWHLAQRANGEFPGSVLMFVLRLTMGVPGPAVGHAPGVT